MFGAKNARVVPVVDYAPDPNGAGLFAALTRARALDLNSRVRPVVELSATFDGWAQSPQSFIGLAALGRARPVREASSELAGAKGTAITDPALRIFQARMARGAG